MIKTIRGGVFACVVSLILWVPVTAHAVSLSVDSAVPSGLVDYVLPRFSLKTQVRFDRIEVDGDLQLTTRQTDAGIPICTLNDGTVVSLSAARWVQSDPSYLAFRDWLRGESGRASISDYRENGQIVATPIALDAPKPPPVVIIGDPVRGERLSLVHCSRCHKVDRAAKYSGLDSSSSFHAMRGFEDWLVRFASFFTVSPHKALISVKGSGITQDRALIPMAPIDLSIEDVNDIVAFVHGLEPLDLGRPIQFNP